MHSIFSTGCGKRPCSTSFATMDSVSIMWSRRAGKDSILTGEANKPPGTIACDGQDTFVVCTKAVRATYTGGATEFPSIVRNRHGVSLGRQSQYPAHHRSDSGGDIF